MDFQKINTILMRVIAVLLMLVLLSTAMVTGRFARYISSSTGSDSARVAKFAVDYTLTEVDGKSGEYTLTVHNNSEVAIKYSVSIMFTEALDNDDLKVTLNGTDGTFDNATDTFTFVDDAGFQLAPNTNSTPYTLTITLENSQLITDKDNDEGRIVTKTLNFKVAVTATQID